MRPRALDLFCGAGGAGMGLYRAGFDVVGVDVRPQPRYPFRFAQGDALRPPVRIEDFDFVWASPPCQAYTGMSSRWRGLGGKADGHPDLIGPVRDMLAATGVPYVIENVIGARQHLRCPILLCGAQFGLGVHRPRLFEASFFLLVPQGLRSERGVVGVYGDAPDGRRLKAKRHEERAGRPLARAAKGLDEGARAMGIDWMVWSELKEAIPPAYAEFIGRAFLGQATLALGDAA